MKKILLALLALICSTGLWAQSKTTGTVNLLSGMTAELMLNSSTTTATLTLTGPSDRWFALQFGSFVSGGGMQAGQDVVYYNGATLVDAVHNGIGSAPSADANNNWTMTSNTVSGGTRTIVATRAFNTGDSNDYTFVYSNTDIDFAYARSQSASYALAYHGATNRGYQLNKTFSCVAPNAPTASAQSFCTGATVTNLVASGATGATFNWYNNPTGGTALSTSAMLASGTYYVAQTVSACESSRTAVTVTVNSATAQTMNNLSACGSYTLPALNANNNYYTGTNGSGTLLTAGTVITTSQTVYIYAQSGTTPNCTDQSSFTVTINATPNAIAPANQSACGQYTLPALTGAGNYYTGAGGTGTMLMAGNVITTTQTIYVYAQSGTTPNCTDQESFTVTITNTASPAAAATQNLCDGSTVFNLEATGTALNWYTTPTGGTPLAGTTVLASGNYYVDQTMNGCTSARTQVTVNISPLSNPVVNDQAFCDEVIIGLVDVTVVGNQGFIVPVWYDVATGGTPLNVNSTITISGTYYVSESNGSCESGREAVTITINTTPDAPTGIDTQEFNTGETVADLEINTQNGAVITWYVLDEDVLEEIPATTVLADEGMYYVTQTVNGCESEPFMVMANEVLGTAGFTASAVKLYPNPVTDILTITAKDNITAISVTNLLGQELLHSQAKGNETRTDLSSLQKGTYIIRIKTESGVSSYKIIKQ